MKIVAMETSSRPGQIALVAEHQVVAHEKLADDRRTTETFATVLDTLLKKSGWRPRDVDLFAVSQGPGSFTGLRIGVTAAKVFAYASGCQVMGVNTLELLATQALTQGLQSPSTWAVVDAQRRQCFVAQFQIETQHVHQTRMVSEMLIVDQPSWFEQLATGTHLTGYGLVKVPASALQHLITAPRDVWEPNAVELANLAARHVAAGVGCDAWRLVPEYGRRSAAEEKRRSRGATS